MWLSVGAAFQQYVGAFPVSRPGKFTIRLNILKYRYVKKSLVGYIPCYIGLMSFTIHLIFIV